MITTRDGFRFTPAANDGYEVADEATGRHLGLVYPVNVMPGQRYWMASGSTMRHPSRKAAAQHLRGHGMARGSR